jgi:hypothetical protein
LERLEDRTVPATILWDGGPTGQGTNWLDPVNWAGDVLPGPNDDAVVGPAAPGQSAEVTLTGTAAVRSATVSGGTLRLLNASFSGSLVNRGTVLALGTDIVAGALTTVAGSTIRVVSDATYKDCDLTVPSFTNNGRIELISNSRLRVGTTGAPTGTLTNASGGTITASTNSSQFAATYVSGAAFNNQGTVSVGPSIDLLVATSGSSSNAGSIDIALGGIFSFNRLDPIAGQEPQFVNSGAVTIGGGGAVPQGLFHSQNYRHRSGSLTGAGQVSLDGATFETDYTVAVGYLSLSAGYEGPQPRDINGPGTVTNPAGHTLAINGRINAPLVNQGTLRAWSATVTSPLSNSGTITVFADMTWNTPGGSTNSGTIDISGGNFTLNQPPGASFATTGTITVAAGRTFAINGGYSQAAGTTTVAGALTVNGNFSQGGGGLAVELNGPTPGTEYGQIKVTGTVALSGPLSVTLGYPAGPNDSLRIFDNDGTDPVTGTFAGLPEGARLAVNGQRFTFSYIGGTGNDVVLSPDRPATLVWDGGPTSQGTSWSDPVNWDRDFVPGPNDDVVIGPLAGASTVVTLAANTPVHNLTVTGATLRLVNTTLTVASLTNAGTIELTSDGGSNSSGLAVGTGSITNAVGGTIRTVAGSGGDRTLTGRIDNQGTLSMGTKTTWSNAGGSTNSGTFSVTSGFVEIRNASPFTSSGTINAASGAVIFDQQSSFSVTGTVNIAAGGWFGTSEGTFTNFSGFTLTGGTFNVAGTLWLRDRLVNLAADLVLDGPQSRVVTSGWADALLWISTITSAGRLTLLNGRNLSFTNATGALNAGVLTVGAGCSVPARWGLPNTGTLAGGGTVVGNVTNTGTVSPDGVLTVSGSYSATGGLAVDLNGPTPGTQYDQLKVNGTVALGGPLVVRPGYPVPKATVFRIIDIDLTDAVTGTLTGLPEGATLVVNGQTFRISYVGGDGNDVTLTRVGPISLAPITEVNDNVPQRSRVTSLAVWFSTQVTFAGPAADAFLLRRDGDGAAVAFTVTTDVIDGQTVATLTGFTGAATEFGSLANGDYTLTALAARISTLAGPLDGNGDGVRGDDYTFGSAQGLYRLYGDATGDRRVDAGDLTMFRQTFGSMARDTQYLNWPDVNGDGAINGIDLTRFRQVYFASPPRVAAVQVDDGSPQRSRIASLTVSFSAGVTFAGAPGAAFVLTREDGTPVTFAATATIAGDATRVTLDHFAGPAVEAGSLADGRYTLKVLASQVSTPGGALDGNADGTPGDDYTFGAAQGLVRKYGDGNGDGKVDAADLALFRQTFGRTVGDPLYLSGFDVNGDGAINGTDLTRFRQAFGAGG